MAKLSQIIPKKVRKVIPFYFYDENNELVQDKITVFNPTKEQIDSISSKIKNKNNEEIFLILIDELTDIEIDEEGKKDFANFLKYFDDVNTALQMELYDIISEISISSFDSIQKLMSLPDEMKAKHIAFNPEMAKAFEKLKELSEEEEEIEEEPTPNELEEFRKWKAQQKGEQNA